MKTTTNWKKDGYADILIAKIVDILSYQCSITSQGLNYEGEKDWALNKIKDLIKEERQNVITLIENEETDYPDRESDEFDEGGRMFKQAILGKLRSK